MISKYFNRNLLLFSQKWERWKLFKRNIGELETWAPRCEGGLWMTSWWNNQLSASLYFLCFKEFWTCSLAYLCRESISVRGPGRRLKYNSKLVNFFLKIIPFPTPSIINSGLSPKTPGQAHAFPVSSLTLHTGGPLHCSSRGCSNGSFFPTIQ